MADASTGPDGIAVVDKEAGWTSHDVVAKARGILHTRKVGHSGTLDPDATGVLILGVGRVTRLLRYLTALPKTYTAEIVLGTETTTLDASGDVVATHDMTGISLADALVAAKDLTGPIMQIPPMVSAVKVDGKRLHELAREGKEVEREPRPVTIHRFVLDEGPEEHVLRAEVECSSGTYVRTLAADLGHALGGGAHLRELRRTSIGSFDVAAARPLERIELLEPREALRDYAALLARGELVDAVRHGKVLDRDAMGIPEAVMPPARAASGSAPPPGSAVEGPWAVLDERGELLAVYEAHKGGTAKPAVVIQPAAT